MSKNCLYENPFFIKGKDVRTGLEEKSKGICKDRIIGTWKAGNKEELINPMNWF